MNLIDAINLMIKIVDLFFLAALSQVAAKKRIWMVSILALGFWLTVFRAALIRSMSLYVGVFQKESPEIVKGLMDFLQSGAVGNITDLLILIGSVAAFALIASEKTHQKKE